MTFSTKKQDVQTVSHQYCWYILLTEIIHGICQKKGASPRLFHEHKIFHESVPTRECTTFYITCISKQSKNSLKGLLAEVIIATISKVDSLVLGKIILYLKGQSQEKVGEIMIWDVTRSFGLNKF
jgi:hypothetical protein